MNECLFTFGIPLEGGFLAQEFEQEKRMLVGLYHESRERSEHAVQDLDGVFRGGRGKFGKFLPFFRAFLNASFHQIEFEEIS